MHDPTPHPTPRSAGADPDNQAHDANRSAASPISEAFHRLAVAASLKFGSPWAFVAAVALIVGWAVTGPIFAYNETWQLVINTGTTIITFLMVFLIQSTQNRDSRALHLKLDELIRAGKGRSVFADLEDASEQELDAFQEEFRLLRQQGISGGEAATRASHAARRGRKRHHK